MVWKVNVWGFGFVFKKIVFSNLKILSVFTWTLDWKRIYSLIHTILFFFKLFILSVSCCSSGARGWGAFSGCGDPGLLSSCRARASHCSYFSCCGSQALEHRLSCSVACGIFPDRDSNLCLLRWQADFSPLSRQGSPHTIYNGWFFSPKIVVVTLSGDTFLWSVSIFSF